MTNYIEIFLENFSRSMGYSAGTISALLLSVPFVARYSGSIRKIFNNE